MKDQCLQRTVGLLFAVSFMVAGVVACQSSGSSGNGNNVSNGATAKNGQQKGDGGSGSEAHEGWELQFEDDFERDEIGDDWKVISGEWEIQDGWLVARDTGFGDAQVVLDKELPGSQRLEFDAKSENPGDLTALLNINDSGYQSGYFFGLGSNGNDRSKLLIQDMNVKNWDTKIEPGKTHHVIAERDGKMLRHIVDGETKAEFEHRNPLKGRYHQKVGFYVWTQGKFDSVKVYTKEE